MAGFLAHPDRGIQAVAYRLYLELHSCTNRQTAACWQSVWCDLGHLFEFDVWLML